MLKLRKVSDSAKPTIPAKSVRHHLPTEAAAGTWEVKRILEINWYIVTIKFADQVAHQFQIRLDM